MTWETVSKLKATKRFRLFYEETMVRLLAKSEQRLGAHQKMVREGVGSEQFVRQTEIEIQIVSLILEYRRDEAAGQPPV